MNTTAWKITHWLWCNPSLPHWQRLSMFWCYIPWLVWRFLIGKPVVLAEEVVIVEDWKPLKVVDGEERLKIELRATQKALMATREALIWCSGSIDFSPEGKAHKGWEKIAAPAIELSSRILGYWVSEREK